MKKFNSNLAITVTSIVLAIMVVLSEYVPVFKSTIASLTGHHWSAKGVIITILYFVVGFIGKKEISEKSAFTWTIASIVVMLTLFLILYSSHA